MCPHRKYGASSYRAGGMTHFALRMRFVSLVLLWLFRLDLISTSIENVDAQLEAEKHYRTSDFGRRFLIAIAHRPKPHPSVVAKLTFMTYEYESRVTVSSPQHQTQRNAKYTKEIFFIKSTMPITINITSSNIIEDIGTGNAMKITADKDILVRAILCTQDQVKDSLVLPPTNSYASTYIVISTYERGFLLTLADHENTIVTFSFAESDSSFTAPCDWNSTCGPGVSGPSSLVLNATTYAYMSWGFEYKPKDIDWSQMTGCRISSSRPVLVIGGMSEKMAMAVMPRPSSFSNMSVFTLNCRRNMKHYCDDIDLYGFPLINIPFKMKIYHHNGNTLELNKDPNKVLKVHAASVEFIISSVPIALLFFRDKGIDLLTNLAPVSMWPSYIMFSEPVVSSDWSYIIHLIVHTDMKDSMLYNGRFIGTYPWTRTNNFHIYPCERLNLVMNESHVTLMQVHPRHTFMAYITTVNVSIRTSSPFGVTINLGMTYPHPENKTNYKCQTQNETMRAGDDVDNDCDDKIDEEILNRKDDDGDGLIDEDIAEKRVMGEWSFWLPWKCRGACRSKEGGRLERFRSCNNPPQRNKGGTCSGSNVERGTGSCRMKCSSIPESCALGNFGVTCEDECPPNCAMTFCERDRGQCFACKPGSGQIPFCQHVYKTLSGAINILNDSNNNLEQMISIFIFELIFTFMLVIWWMYGKRHIKQSEPLHNTNVASVNKTKSIEEATSPTDSDFSDSVDSHSFNTVLESDFGDSVDLHIVNSVQATSASYSDDSSETVDEDSLSLDD